MNTTQQPQSTSPDRFSLAVPVETDCLSRIRELISELASSFGFTDHEVAKIVMAVDEACSNIVRHGYRADHVWVQKHRNPEIRLSVSAQPDRLVIDVSDHGHQFDFAACRKVNIQDHLRDMRTNGYGIPIIQEFMDEVRYISDEQAGNTLQLIKYFQKPAAFAGSNEHGQ